MTDYFDVNKAAFATALHPLLTGSIASDKGPASGVGDDPGGSGSGGSTIKDTTTSDNISTTHPSHPTSAGSDSSSQGDDNGTLKSPLLTQVCQSDPKAPTLSKLPSADKDRSGPGGDSGGGNDPPLTEPRALGQDYVSGVGDTGDGTGGSTFKGIIISGGSDPEFCSRADPASYRGNSGGGAEGPLPRFHSAPCA